MGLARVIGLYGSGLPNLLWRRTSFKTLLPVTLESPEPAVWTNVTGFSTQAVMDLSYLHSIYKSSGASAPRYPSSTLLPFLFGGLLIKAEE